MRITDGLALSGFVLWAVTLTLVFVFSRGADAEGSGIQDEHEFRACNDGQHQWHVWMVGLSPDDYYYRCSRCGWVALREEVEQG